MNTIPSENDLLIRWERVQNALKLQQADACLITSFVNIYYLTGRVFDGYIYVPAGGDPVYFVRKPGIFEDPKTVSIRKPEDIPVLLQAGNIPLPETIGLEAGQLTYNDYIRLKNLFPGCRTIDATALFRQARMIKTPWEIEQFRYSAQQHNRVYEQIPALFQACMTDLELQYKIEKVMRQHGSIGVFRAFGGNMDIFMGSILTGDNAATPSPCDFALGGAGNYTLPLGANGSPIKPGQSVMVDMAGNYTAYMTDMTRVYACGALPDIACQAHQTSIDMHVWLMENGKPGLSCAGIYSRSLEMAHAAGLSAHFMGTVQQAKFVGHGVGIEINELPVLTERSKNSLQENMVFAYEPKFVFPGTGAVGIENTYRVTANGLEKLTVFREGIIPLLIY